MKNSKIKRILVPVDFSETSEIAVAEAMTLAKLLKAELFLIHVTEFDRNYMAVVEPNMETIFPDLKEAKVIVEKKLETMRMKIQKESGINPILFLAEGIVHSEIIDYSKKKKINLIVMGTHGVSGLKEIFVGTNTYRVVTLSDIPVLTMQKKLDKKGFKNILIPIDNSLHSREKVNIAMVFAEVYGAKIHIIGLPNSEDKLELKQFKIKLESVEKIVKKAAPKALKVGDKVLIKELKYLGPQDQGELDFSVKVKNSGVTINDKISISDITQSFSVKVN